MGKIHRVISKLKSKQVKQPGTLSWAQISREVPVEAGFPSGSDGKEPTCNAGDLGSIPELGRSPGGGHGIFAWRIPRDRGVWWATIQGVAKSRTWLSDSAWHQWMQNLRVEQHLLYCGPHTNCVASPSAWLTSRNPDSQGASKNQEQQKAVRECS